MRIETLKDIDRAFKALETVESTEVRCLSCKHCIAVYKNPRKILTVKCELYSSPMREFECFEKDPLINIE